MTKPLQSSALWTPPDRERTRAPSPALVIPAYRSVGKRLSTMVQCGVGVTDLRVGDPGDPRPGLALGLGLGRALEGTPSELLETKAVPTVRPLVGVSPPPMAC